MLLQFFCGGSKQTQTTTYTPTAQELALQDNAVTYSNAISPNAISLNTLASNLIGNNNYGTKSVNYENLTNDANGQIASGQSGIAGLTSGQLPSAYTDNMTSAIKSTVQNSLGSAIADKAAFGVLSSSAMDKAINNIATDASNTTAQNYLNNISTLGGLYNNQIQNAGQKIGTTAAGQEAALASPKSLWNMSLGLNTGGTTTALGAVAGKGTTTSNTSTDSGFGSILGGLATGYASNSAGIFCFSAGTQIEGPYGFTPIEAVKVGDDVLAQDKDCCYIRDVMDILKGGRMAETVCLTTSLGDVVTTPTQPLMTPAGYAIVSDMKPGDDIYHYGRIVQVKSIEPAGTQRVYDLKVHKTNSYIANGFIAKGGTDEW